MLVARSGGGCAPADIPVPVPLLIAQFLLPLILVLGTVVTAVKIVLVNLRHDTQIALARTLHGHTIICGLAETGMEAVRQLVLQHGDVIAIALDPKSEGARICESLGVPRIYRHKAGARGNDVHRR
jgi:voltage-gated potassium channel Kch